jgi:Protein of unknown function (DUF3363)
MIVAITEAMEGAPKHSLRLVEATPPRNQAVLYLGNCQVRTILRIPTLRSIPNTTTAPAADLTRTGKHHAGAPTAAGADHPHATPAELEGCARETNLSGDVEASGKFAVIQSDKHFTLVPWRAILERHRGREVAGIVRGMGVSWQLGMQRDRGHSR